jgi:molybdopterin synthase sulfur carrier subunit
MATVIIPAQLRKLTNGKDRVTAKGRNVRQLIEDLDRQFPGFSEQLLQEGDLKPSIAVSIDGEMGTGGVLEPVGEDSEVFFLPALGGGQENNKE